MSAAVAISRSARRTPPLRTRSSRPLADGIATTGTPRAIASAAAMPNVSTSEVIRNTSNRSSQGVTSACSPANSTTPVSPERFRLRRQPALERAAADDDARKLDVPGAEGREDLEIEVDALLLFEPPDGAHDQLAVLACGRCDGMGDGHAVGDDADRPRIDAPAAECSRDGVGRREEERRRVPEQKIEQAELQVGAEDPHRGLLVDPDPAWPSDQGHEAGRERVRVHDRDPRPGTPDQTRESPEPDDIPTAAEP